MAVMIAGRRFWLWRAVDDEGEVLDLLAVSGPASAFRSIPVSRLSGWRPQRSRWRVGIVT
jgi:hypothetical protein